MGAPGGSTSQTDNDRTNRVAVLCGIRDIRMEDREVPVPGPEEILVAVSAVGVCGSDVHYYEHGRIGSFVVEAPLILGHEAAGVVVERGEGADRHQVGQRVAIEPGRPCGRCRVCLSGSYNLCPKMRFLATPPVDGAFVTYLTVPQDWAFALPDTVSDEAGALLEPLSVGIWACQRAGIRLGSRTLITGAGAIGLCTLMAASAGGALTTIVDPEPARRQRASQLGAGHVFEPGDPGLADLAGDVDAFIECSGTPEALASGLRLLAPKGTAVVVGMSAEDDVSIPLSTLQQREISVTGTFRYANTYPLAVELVASGRIDPIRLIDARFPLEQVDQALGLAAKDPSVVKAMVVSQPPAVREPTSVQSRVKSREE